MSRGVRVSSCVQEPKKENFKMGRGGEKGFSINVMECHSTVTKAAAIFTSEKEMLMVGTLIKSEGEEPTAVKPVAGT